jgi:peptidoglycan hydrolase CwlO-like protein
MSEWWSTAGGVQSALRGEIENRDTRIDELEAENKRLRLEVAHANDTADVAIERAKKLEAKLTKSGERFNQIRKHIANPSRGVPSIDTIIIERCKRISAKALAELKGQDDE